MVKEMEYFCEEASDCMDRVGSLTDCTIRAADGSKFSTSKALLAAHSRFFGNMFADLCADEHTITLDESAADVVCLLNHVYADDEYEMTAENIHSCLHLAKKYDMPRLLRHCDKFLLNLDLEVSTLPHWIEAANTCQLPGLMKHCITYASKHLQQIISHRRREQKSATCWLEALPAENIVAIMGSHTRFIGCLASRKAYGGGGYNTVREGKELTDAEIIKLEKHADQLLR